MENINNDRTRKYQEKINELFGELVPERVYDRWIDTFEIESVEGNLVTITYNGNESIKSFKKNCKKVLSTCVYSIIGTDKKIKIVRRSKLSNPKTKKNLRAVKFFALGMVFICIATSVFVVTFNYIGNRKFNESFYSTSSIKVDSRVRVIQLSDLHTTSYGKNNETLLKRIKALKPDIILCTGDIVSSVEDDVDYAVSLSEKLVEIAPTYYIYGNHEVKSIYDFTLDRTSLDEEFGFNDDNRDETALLKIEDSFEEKIESTGVKVLKNEMDTIQVKTMTVDIYGVLTSNPSSFWPYSAKSFSNYLYENPNNLKITAIHEPILFEKIKSDYWGDLMVAGHTHGGVVRVPVLGPLYTVEGGLFPERNNSFVYGRYDIAGCPLIVSGGLENKNVFRLNNEPELVIIDINKF